MLILRLAFLIVYQWSLRAVGNEKPIQLVTLGRSFKLGMLYDIRSDNIITGITLWGPQNLANHTDKRNQSFRYSELIAEDSLHNKAHALGVEENLKLSLLGGLISLSGSAKYAEDYQRTHHATRLTLKYSTTTHFEQLTMKHLEKANLDHPDIHDKDIATHVVTGILYGADAFFVFDRILSKDESKEDISGSLKAIFNKPIFKTDGEAKLNLSDQENSVVDKLSCKYYGDFRLSENPSTFDEALEIYRKLPSLANASNESVISKKVWLYPLHLLDNKKIRIVREISSNLVNYSISVIENLRALEVTASDLSNSLIFTHLSHMRKRLLDFVARLSELQRDLKEKIALYIPQLRGNTDVEESVLFNLFKEVDSSPFNHQKLQSWLTEKEKEIAVITKSIEKLITDRSVNITIQSRYEAFGEIGYGYIFCLLFRSVEENDLQLTDMYNYRYEKANFNLSNTHRKRKPWFEDQHILGRVQQNLQQFIDFAKANNVENGKIKFIIDEEYSVGDVKSVELALYEHGSEKEGFIIPSKPGAPHAKFVTDNNITLEWKDVANGTEPITKYKVMYQACNNESKDEKWIEIYTNGSEKEIIISNLPSKTIFVFKVQSITTIGLSPISDISEPIETLKKNETISLFALKQTPSNINVLRKQNAQIKLEMNSLPTLNITWLFNGNSIESSAKYQTKIQIILDVNKTDYEDEGIYTAILTNGVEQLVIPVNITIQSTFNIPKNATWSPNGTTVAGGNGKGNELNQLYGPWHISVDDDRSLYVTDRYNHRIVSWKENASEGVVIAGGNGKGNALNQLNSPTDVIVDKENNSMIICDRWRERVVRWDLHKNIGDILVDNVDCFGIAMDDDGFIYVSDTNKHEVRKYRIGDKNGTLVAGGNGQGYRLNQLDDPSYLVVDRQRSVYVSDNENHRVMKWEKNAKEGIVVAGGNGIGSNLDQLSYPDGIAVDELGTVYVADTGNHRVMRWFKGDTKGDVIAGRNGENQANQFSWPVGLSFDRDGNLYVADSYTNCVQRFSIV